MIRSLPPATLTLSQLWLEFLSFPVLYLYLGQPDMHILTMGNTNHMIPDIAASMLFGLSIFCETQSVRLKQQPLQYS